MSNVFCLFSLSYLINKKKKKQTKKKQKNDSGVKRRDLLEQKIAAASKETNRQSPKSHSKVTIYLQHRYIVDRDTMMIHV